MFLEKPHFEETAPHKNKNYDNIHLVYHSWYIIYGAVHIWRHAPGGGGGQAKCDSLWQGEGGVNVVWRHTI